MANMTRKRLIDRSCATGLDLGLGCRNSAALPVVYYRMAEVATQTDERYWPEATLWIQEPGNSPSGNKCEGSGSAAGGCPGKYRRSSPSAKDTKAAGWPEAALVERTPTVPAVDLWKEELAAQLPLWLIPADSVQLSKGWARWRLEGHLADVGFAEKPVSVLQLFGASRPSLEHLD